MRSRIDAILVIRQGGEVLSRSVASIRAQSERPGRLLIVDTTADSTVPAVYEAALEGSAIAVDTLSLPFSTSFPVAVEKAMEHLYPVESEINQKSWMWLLRDDVVCHDSALAQLALSVEAAPLIKVAGPKQRMGDRPAFLRELGETMTPFGQRMALAERELDQAQYDRLSDVLAVGEAGMLIHAATLRDVGGFDPALPGLDGGLDVCVRVRLQGHRIVVVPRSVIEVASSSAEWNARKKLSEVSHHFLATRAWLYRRLVYAPVWALIPLLVTMVPWSLVRALAHLVAKRPDRMVTEGAAAWGTLGKLGAVFRARAVVRDTRTTSWDTIDALRMGVREVRKRRAITQEGQRARVEELAHIAPAPRGLPHVPWMTAGLAALAAIVLGPWWGAKALIGGGALPLGASVQEVWATVWSLTPTQWGFDAAALPADPAAFVFALLGSLTWWEPSAAVVYLLLAAIPLAGISAWWGFSHLFTQAWVTTFSAVIWAMSPTLLFAISDGRIGAVVAHVALPWLVGSLLSAHQSWQRVGTASLAAIVVTASAPVLWPAVIVGVVVLVVVRGWGRPLPMFIGVLPFVLLPSLVLAAPRFFEWWARGERRWWDNWGVLFADPGASAPVVPSSWWEMVLGLPAPLPESIAFALGDSAAGVLSLIFLGGGLLLLLTAVVSLALGNTSASASFAGLFGLGIITATTAPVLFSGYEGPEAVFVWPGTGVSLLVLGTLIGAGSGLDRVVFHDAVGNPLSGGAQWWARCTTALVLIATLVVPVAVGFQVWGGEAEVSPAKAARTLPAFVAAEAALTPAVGTLVIDPGEEIYHVSLHRGSGETLSRTSTLVRGRSSAITTSDEDLARLAAMLIRPSSAEPMSTLQAYGIRFVLLRGDSDGEAALALSRQPFLLSASSLEAGQLWQAPEVTLGRSEDTRPAPGGWNQLFLALLGIVLVLAVPTQRRAKASPHRLDDAIPVLGEGTSDDV
ncbi:MAG: GT2 family glycosyltransferase [Pontimonas sp.]|jgi:GT2 family glycosyltransferase